MRYVRFRERRGMVAAWRAAFEQATARRRARTSRGPATTTDGIRTGSRRSSARSQQYPDVVLAYPLTQRIDPDGTPLAKPARQFETFGIADRDARWRLFNRSDAVAAGDMVYGLMRASAMREAGVFREVLCPDRLLLAELTLRGQIRQVPEVLWYRRQFAAGSVERQRSTLFAPGTTSAVALDASVVHARALAVGDVRACSRIRAAAAAGRDCAADDCRLCGALCVAPLRQVERAARDPVGARLAAVDRTSARSTASLLGVYGVLVAARHLGITPLVEKDLRAPDRAAAPLAPARMKILFIARHFTYFRNYETAIAELARRGHQLHLAAEREEDLGGREMVERLAREHRRRSRSAGCPAAKTAGPRLRPSSG